MKFVAIGNTMRDSVAQADGTITASHMGGPSPFAYAGIRVWCDDVQMLTGVGLDHDDYFGEWIRENNICTDGIVKVAEKTHNFVLYYNEDGSYDASHGMDKDAFAYEIGAMEMRPAQFEEYTKDAECCYFFYDCENIVFWNQIAEIKKKYGWQMMWEMSGTSAYPERLPRIKQIIKDLNIEMFSMNFNECKRLFGCETREEAIAQLKTMGARFVFLRDGSNGSYAIEGDKHWHIPSVRSETSVDPTGCGNTSTGTAMYGYYVTKDPIMACIMANISAGYNAAQYGLIPHFDAEMRADAQKRAAEMRAAFKED